MMFSKVLAPHNTMPQGLLVFASVADALRAGYMVYDKIEDGYLVRTMTAGGWALAIVRCKL